jgi:excisionase family DNA binding protein
VFYTTKAVQDILKIGRTSMYQLLRERKIDFCRYGNEYRFTKQQINAYLKSVGLPPVFETDSALQTDSSVVECYHQPDSTLKTEYSDNDASPSAERKEEAEMKNTNKTYSKRGNPFKRKGKKGITWVAMYFITDSEGKRKQKYKGGFQTKAEAQMFLDDIRAKIANHTYREPSKITVKEYIEKWFEDNYKRYENNGNNQRQYSSNTIYQYENDIRRNIVPYIGGILLQALNRQHVKKLYDDLLERGLSANSIRLTNSVLSKALNEAVYDGLIAINPCKGVRKPKITHYAAKVFDKEETIRLMNAIKGTSVELPILIALSLGLRRGEALGIRFSDCDFRNNTIHIQRQVTMVKHDGQGCEVYGLAPLKTEKSNRIIGAPPTLMGMVKKRWVQVAKDKRKCENYQDMDLVCCHEDGTFLNPKSVYRQYRRIIARAGLPANRFHDLRGTQITMAYAQGAPLKYISENAGHSTINMTANTYCQVTPESRHVCADIMQSVLFGTQAATT